MESAEHDALLESGLQALSVPATPGQRRALLAFASTLLKWNARVNLTAITEAREVLDKHLLDSAAALLAVPPGPTRVLDLGAGPGFPGLPWAVLREDLDVTLVDAVQKKVAFMKTAIATLGLGARARAVHKHVEASDPLGPFDVVVSRAFMDTGPWLTLAQHFVPRGGLVIAMSARVPEDASGRAGALGFELEVREFRLPLSGDPRAVLAFRRS